MSWHRSQYTELEDRPSKGHCKMMMAKRIRKTGSDNSYCHECTFYFTMPCLENQMGMSEECTKGYWRLEAT